MNNILLNILRFILLIAIQVLICNNVHLFGFLNPYIYILAILLLPLDIPKSGQYLAAFCAGFAVDCFFLTYGVHASAALLIAFVRPQWIYLMNGRRVNEIDIPLPRAKDLKWLIFYTFPLIFMHHYTIMLLEAFSYKNFWLNTTFAIGNGIFTTIVILCLEYIFISPKRR